LSPPGDLILKPLLEAASAPELEPWVLYYACHENLFTPGDRVLAAVSGGPDSTALLHLLHRLKNRLGIELGVAHFDHGLRGAQSHEDAAFVALLAQGRGLPCHQGQGEVRELARARKISLQMAGRTLRLGFLKDACREHAYTRLALGHTANDQVELFFLRLLRGAGPEGLKGMWPATPEGLVRPLLAVGKAALLAWLKQEGLPYRQDSSNLSRNYLRNRIRLDLLPELKKAYNPRLTEAVWRAQALLQADERLLTGETARLWAEVAREPAPDCYALDLSRFLALDPAWQNRVLRFGVGKILGDRALTSAQVAGLVALARGEQSGGVIPLGDCRVARAGPELHIFRRLPAPPKGLAVTLPITGELNEFHPDTPPAFEGGGWGEGEKKATGLNSLDLSTPTPTLPPQGGGNFKVFGWMLDTEEGWRWEVRERSYRPGEPWPPPHTAWLDAHKVAFPLQVHYFRAGARFWPVGAPGPKKLQDFLVNRKIPRYLRPYIPMVSDARGLIWVAGLRVAEPVKVTPATRCILEIRLSSIRPATRRIWEMLSAIGGGEL
jgi:tRNA(Ile)-lysidine synthase